MEYLRFLKENGARFFAHNAAAASQVETLSSSEQNYLAHEYFTEHFRPFYFAEIAEELGEIGLVYAGSSSLPMNHWQLSIPERFREVMDTAPDRVSYETHRGFILNERFRRDTYVRMGNHDLKYPPPEAWLDVRFGPLHLTGALSLEMDSAGGHARYDGPIYAAVTQALADRSLTYREACEHEALAGFDRKELIEGMKLLCASGQFGTVLSPLRAATARGFARLTSPFNRALLAARLPADSYGASLAAPVLGRGYPVPPIAAVAVLGLDEGAAIEDLVDWVMRWIDARELTLYKARVAVAKEDRRAFVEEQMAAFQRHLLPRLFQFGVLEPA
jgi:hypothetical protein